jgi:hypothetical protein
MGKKALIKLEFPLVSHSLKICPVQGRIVLGSTSDLRRCFALNVCHLPNSYIEILMPKVGASEGFSRRTGQQGRALMTRLLL